MGKASKAPEYPTTTVNTGLFGSSTTSSTGSTYKPTDFQKRLVGITENNAARALNNYLNPNYDDEEYKRGDEYYTNKLTNSLQNNYLNPALQNNLLRGSTASDIMRGFAADLANTEYGRQNDWRNQQLQNYQAAMLPYATIYDMQKGTQGLSQALSNSVGNYNLQKAQMDNATRSSGLGSLIGAIGTIGGAALGGPVGASVGGGLGNLLAGGFGGHSMIA